MRVAAPDRRAFLGHRRQGSQASGATGEAAWVSDTTFAPRLLGQANMVSDTHTVFRDTGERRIPPPAGTAFGEGRLRRPGAEGGEGRA